MRSIFSVTTPAAETSLLTIEELRAAAGVVGSAQDVELRAMGRALSEAIARDCGVAWDGENAPTLLQEECAQSFYLVRCANQLRLARRPATEVSQATLDGEQIDPSRFLLDKASGVIWLRCGDWPAGEVAVQFKAGFEEAPPALKLAATKLMTALWAEKDRDPSLRREIVEGIGTQEFWISPSSDPLLSAEISDLLSPFRERWF